MGRMLDVAVTYLEQTERPHFPAPSGAERNATVMRVGDPPVHFYRYIYALVGDPHHWETRKRMNDEDLAALIKHEDVHIYVLYVDGAPAGFTEIDHRQRETALIRFFGLAPDFIGQGFGRYFLLNAINNAWSLGPERIRLETCTLDHPAALPLYQKLGFTPFATRQGQVELQDD